MLQVILAIDSNKLRNNMQMLITADKSIEITASVSTGIEALSAIKHGARANVMVAGMNMPDLDGVSLIRELQKVSPRTKMIMVSPISNDEYVAKAFLAGAKGYLLEIVSSDELVFAVKHVNSGGRHVCSDISLHLLDKLIQGEQPSERAPDDLVFSAKELEILHLIGEGLSNPEIAQKLFVTPRTVGGHRLRIMEKSMVKTTRELLELAFKYGKV